MISDMEGQIHLLEQEAYASVLRAFKAQSDALTWVYSFRSFHDFSCAIYVDPTLMIYLQILCFH